MRQRLRELRWRLQPERVRERSRVRWRNAGPTPNLTWGIEVTGDDFVEKARAYGVYGPRRTIVEVGPGYGRLLRSALERGVEFGRYVGIEISAENVRHLRRAFPQPNVSFRHADAETVRLDAPADAVISSLTFKHLFPSFEPALRNLASQMTPGGVVAIDLIEGRRRYFEADGVTYIRWYTRPEVGQLFARAGVELRAFDEVRHHPRIARLLAVGVKA